MKPLQSILILSLVAFVCLKDVLAKNSSGSDSDSDSDESGDDYKKRKHYTPSHIPPMVQPYGYPYNHPAYIAPAPLVPYAGYNPPMPYYYGHPETPQHAAPLQPGHGPYPYGGYYNQPAGVTQEPQPHPGTSTINHSLKVNKEYSENDHHYKPDGSSPNKQY